MKKKFAALWIVSLILSIFIMPSVKAANAPASLIISEAKPYNSSDEFIELYNNSAEAIESEKYALVYYNSSNPAVGSPPTASLVLTNNHLPLPGEYTVFSKVTSGVIYIPGSLPLPFSSGLSNSAGCLRLVPVTGEAAIDSSVIIDSICWSNSSSPPSGVYKLPTTTAQSLQRVSYQDITPIFVNDWQAGVMTPFTFLYVLPAPDPDPEIPPPNEEEPSNSCNGVVLSELLPNPAGSDAGREFIELHNPTAHIINLSGCKLETSANSKSYTFNNLEILPGRYVAFYNSETGLTLDNAPGGTVYLIDTNGQDELDEVTYEKNLSDDVSWSLIDTTWLKTYEPTPNVANRLLAEKPCPLGQSRNSETGRCVNTILSAANLTPCKLGQERNPETNRCRSITSLASVLKPCDPGQERNPETNRCRKIDSGNTLTPCKPGQERNPETNRCRNVAGVLSSENPTVEDMLAANTASVRSWWLAGGSLLAALSYAVWEWRNDILLRIKTFREQFLKLRKVI